MRYKLKIAGAQNWPYAIKAYLAISFIILLTCIGLILPILVRESNLQNYDGEEEVFARYALKQAEMLTGGSAEAFLIAQMSIAEIKQLSDSTGECGYDPFLTHHKFEASIQLYSWFAIPYGEVSVTCDSAQIKRQFIP